MDEVSTIAPGTHRLVSDDAITRLSETQKELPWLQTINEAKKVLEEGMPEGQYGLVVGSGPNTTKWRDKKWATLDIDETSQADFIVDANEMASQIPSAGAWDFVFAEAVRMDPKAQKGVHPMRLVNQSRELLKDGGTLVIKTANFENNPHTTLPARDEYVARIAKLGFDVSAEVHTYDHYEDQGRKTSSQQVIYYAKKLPESK